MAHSFQSEAIALGKTHGFQDSIPIVEDLLVFAQKADGVKKYDIAALLDATDSLSEAHNNSVESDYGSESVHGAKKRLFHKMTLSLGLALSGAALLSPIGPAIAGTALAAKSLLGLSVLGAFSGLNEVSQNNQNTLIATQLERFGTLSEKEAEFKTALRHLVEGSSPSPEKDQALIDLETVERHSLDSMGQYMTISERAAKTEIGESMRTFREMKKNEQPQADAEVGKSLGLKG